MDLAERWLGTGHKEVSPGRWVSNDGLRQFRFGQHEVGSRQLAKILPQGSKIDDIVNDIKGMTFETGNEHAVVRLASGQKAIVSGGPGGISFQPGQIKTLFGHTHPTTAPPSAADFSFLRNYTFAGGRLGQSRQYVVSGGQTILIRP